MTPQEQKFSPRNDNYSSKLRACSLISQKLFVVWVGANIHLKFTRTPETLTVDTRELLADARINSSICLLVHRCYLLRRLDLCMCDWKSVDIWSTNFSQ